MPQLENPFPGINPFFELKWGDVHSRLLAYVGDALSEELPPELSVRAEEHIVVSDPDDEKSRFYRADVAVRESWRDGFPPLWQPETDTGTAITVADPVIVLGDPVIDRWLEIQDRDGRLVTAIEILSPRNKEGSGRADYLQKQSDYLAGGANLVEIDLIRGGHPTVAASRALQPPKMASESIICVTRAPRRDRFEVYRVPLRDALPAFRVPLRDFDPDVPLALQPLLDRCHKTGRYWQISDPNSLSRDLSPEDLAWVVERLAAK